MTQRMNELNELMRKIESAHPDARRLHQPQLSKLIEELTAAGEHVPARAKNLNEELLNDAIEARFDNFPV